MRACKILLSVCGLANFIIVCVNILYASVQNFIVCVCSLYSQDGQTGENEYLFKRLEEFRVDSENGKKPTFKYTIAGLGQVCRPAWILAVGFPNRNNSRVRNMEARIRAGRGMTPRVEHRRKPVAVDSTQHALAFIREHILANSQRSPVHTEL